MRGSYPGTYCTPPEDVWCVCPTRLLPAGEYKRLGDTYRATWLMKSEMTGRRYLLDEFDGRKLIHAE